MITENDLIEGFFALGLKPGMGVMVHSSLKSFGHVLGGANTVIQALMKVLTPEGNLLMPSFNHGLPFQEDSWGERSPKGGFEPKGYFSPLETPTVNGIIPDIFWRMPGVCRSLDPTHSFAAWGKNAEHYVADHHRTLTMGPKSPLGLLHEDGGYGLLLGVGYEANTFHHVVEMSTGAQCLGKRNEVYPVRLASGRVINARTWGWRGGTCPFTDEGRYGDIMAQNGFESVKVIGSSRVTFFSLADCFSVVASMLLKGFAGYPPCVGCPIRPRQVSQTVESDWDDLRNCLLPSSEAWDY